MSDEAKGEADVVSTEISYCPDLDIYHYLKADGTEYFFTSDQLELAIETYGKANDHRQAEFMAGLTAFARRFPHHRLSFDAVGKLSVKGVPKPHAPETPEDVVEVSEVEVQKLPPSKKGE